MVKKFIQKVVGAKGFKKGALRKKMGVKGKEKISVTSLNKKIMMLKKKEMMGKLSPEELKMMREMVFAKNMMMSKKG